MTPDDVTITDNMGRLLRRQIAEGSGAVPMPVPGLNFALGWKTI